MRRPSGAALRRARAGSSSNALRIGMARRAKQRTDVAALPPPRPAYITATRSAIFGDDAEVVGDEQQRPCPISRRSLSISARICAWIVTSRAVVGSSAISSDGLHAERHRDHHALPHAARQLVRIFVDAPPRSGDLHELQHLHCPRRRTRAAEPQMQPRRLRRSVRRPRRRGFRLVIGSWKIMPISAPRSLRMSVSSAWRDRRISRRDAEADLAARYPSRRMRNQAHDRQAGHRLAGAGFADEREGLARVAGERDTAHRA